MGNANSEQIIWTTGLDANDASAKERIGAVRVEDSVTYGRRKYVYIQNADAAVTISQYDAVAWDRASYMKKVTSDYSDTSLQLPAGVCLDTINPSYYGWCLAAGYAEVINQDGGGDVVTGDSLVLGSVDGRVNREASGTGPTVTLLGIADVIDVGTYTCSGYVRCGGAI